MKSFTEIRKELADLDMVIRKTADEYIVDFRGSDTDSSYHTGDLQDAYETACHMADRRWLNWAAQYGYDN